MAVVVTITTGKTSQEDATDVFVFETKELAMKFVETEYPRYYNNDEEEGHENHWCFKYRDVEYNDEYDLSDTVVKMQEYRIISTEEEIRKKRYFTDEYYKREEESRNHEHEKYKKKEFERLGGEVIFPSPPISNKVISFNDYLLVDKENDKYHDWNVYIKSPKMKIVDIQETVIPIQRKDIGTKDGENVIRFTLEYIKNKEKRTFSLIKSRHSNCWVSSTDHTEWTPKIGEYMKFMFYTSRTYSENISTMIIRKGT